jgi:gamma-glutamyltranspeptidase / glutathione hydrolase
MARDFHRPGRSPAMASEAMAATSHPLATLAAIDILKDGGTAADAAVAAVAVLCVVEPGMTGIGGDCFTLVSKPGQPVWGYNGSGRAAAASSSEALRAQGLRAIDMYSAHAVTVPGAIDAWDALLKAHGRFGLDRVLARAIHYAEHGFPVAPRVAYDWAAWTQKLSRHDATARHYLRERKAPAAGEMWKLPALAQTLRTIARDGARAFYEGEIADEIVTTARDLGSVITAEDLARHRGDIVAPISANYRGLDVSRDSAERTGHRGAGRAQYSRELRSCGERARQRG